MEQLSPMRLHLTIGKADAHAHRCSLCHFIDGSGDGNREHKRANSSIPRSRSRTTDFSFYTARTTSSSVSNTPPGVIRVTVPASPPQIPALRHKTSPTRTSLRELREEQSRQALLGSKRSEELLQHAYESQILEYLNSPYANLDAIEG